MDAQKIGEEKKTLRKQMLQQRRAVSADEALAMGRKIADRIEDDPSYQRADAVMYYLAMPGECNLDILIEQALRQEKKVYIPYCLPGRHMEAGRLMEMGHWEKGPLGLRNLPKDHEIIPPDQLDLVLVPAVCCGLDGARVGMGAGYYDRFLRKVPFTKRKAAIWDFQVLPSVPHDAWDLRVSGIFTEKRTLTVKSSKG